VERQEHKRKLCNSSIPAPPQPPCQTQARLELNNNNNSNNNSNHHDVVVKHCSLRSGQRVVVCGRKRKFVP